MSPSNDIKVHRFPTAEELGQVASLEADQQRGWDIEVGPDATPDLP